MIQPKVDSQPVGNTPATLLFRDNPVPFKNSYLIWEFGLELKERKGIQVGVEGWCIVEKVGQSEKSIAVWRGILSKGCSQEVYGTEIERNQSEVIMFTTA